MPDANPAGPRKPSSVYVVVLKGQGNTCSHCPKPYGHVGLCSGPDLLEKRKAPRVIENLTPSAWKPAIEKNKKDKTAKTKAVTKPTTGLAQKNRVHRKSNLDKNIKWCSTFKFDELFSECMVDSVDMLFPSNWNKLAAEVVPEAGHASIACISANSNSVASDVLVAAKVLMNLFER